MEYIQTHFRTYALCSKETRAEREKLCNECDYLNNLNQCNICHCFMFVKNKFEEAKCPIGKW